ncbi:hypothetical protein TNCV_797831 [Trichonephila clavipes]|nr:hypothetical protein TNCV_797831 [Trichonephila clavipes]
MLSGQLVHNDLWREGVTRARPFWGDLFYGTAAATPFRLQRGVKEVKGQNKQMNEKLDARNRQKHSITKAFHSAEVYEEGLKTATMTEQRVETGRLLPKRV